MKRKFHMLLSTLLILPYSIILIVFGGLPLMEGYNLFFPYLDTEFAPDYSPELFESITTDHNMEEVKSIVGEPLFVVEELVEGKLEISFKYTNDGYLARCGKTDRFAIGDFAWYNSEIVFNSEGDILRIHKGWYYD